jgi:hypothetical protein
LRGTQGEEEERFFSNSQLGDRRFERKFQRGIWERLKWNFELISKGILEGTCYGFVPSDTKP